MRIIVVGVIQNEAGAVLICKMPTGRGVFPGQWGLPGGGIEEGESAQAALERELQEEVGLSVSEIQPLFFSDGTYTKKFPDSRQQDIYMIFLLYACRAVSGAVRLNDEFELYAWVRREELAGYDLNVETRKTFQRLTWM